MMANETSLSTVDDTALQALKEQVGWRSWLSSIGKIIAAGPYLAVALVLVFLWQIRTEGHLTAESGLGYAFGIAGVMALLLLLLYPLRKRFGSLRMIGGTRIWFKLHMFLGVLAPAFILAHSSFNLGSTNSTVALISMLIVSSSGLLGRYFYTRIHYGLYGARATAQSLHKAIEEQSSDIASMLALEPGLQRELLRFAIDGLKPADGFWNALIKALSVSIRARFLRGKAYRAARRCLLEQAQRRQWMAKCRRREITNAKSQFGTYLGTIRRAAQLDFYERLFGYWHVLHIPLFFLMLTAIVVHVVAVHVY